MSTKLFAAGTSALALTALLAAPAVAGPTYTSENGGSFTWYGQINPTFQPMPACPTKLLVVT